MAAPFPECPSIHSWNRAVAALRQSRSYPRADAIWRSVCRRTKIMDITCFDEEWLVSLPAFTPGERILPLRCQTFPEQTSHILLINGLPDPLRAEITKDPVAC